jgi:putative phosphoribosyl transferase
MVGRFRDRVEAGHRLAERLAEFRNGDAIVLGMARGGVVVGYAVAEDLELPLQALVVRKVGAPHQPELGLGAVSETGVRWLDPRLIQSTGATPEYVEREIGAQVAEAQRRQREYDVGPGLDAVRGNTAIVVDDGIATGGSALVGVTSARDLGADEIVLATPVASSQSAHVLAPHVDDLVVLDTPDPFFAVGLYYEDFDQVGDAEVVRYLRAAAHNHERAHA